MELSNANCPAGFISPWFPMMISVSPSMKARQPTTMQVGLDHRRGPFVKAGAIPPPTSEIKTTEFGGATLMKSAILIPPFGAGGLTKSDQYSLWPSRMTNPDTNSRPAIRHCSGKNRLPLGRENSHDPLRRFQFAIKVWLPVWAELHCFAQ
jgi:hypothetical protein